MTNDLYSLNKDMLIKLICKRKEEIIDQCSDRELENILYERKLNGKIELLKKSLLELKNFPHLKKIIEENEDLIKNIKSGKNLLEKLDFLDEKLFCKNYKNEEEKEDDYDNENIWESIHFFLRSDDDVYSIWLNSYDKKHIFCSECGGISIELYKNGKLIRKGYDKKCKFC